MQRISIVSVHQHGRRENHITPRVKRNSHCVSLFSLGNMKYNCNPNKRNQFSSTECSMFCITKDDSRWQPMCSNQLNNQGSCRKDSLLGMEECKSPFGTYELKIPVDKNLECDDTRMTDTNCKDFDVSYREITDGFTLNTTHFNNRVSLQVLSFI